MPWDIFRPQPFTVVLILFFLVVLVTMVYGPIAAALVELFPTRIRYTSMSLPYHIGNGWFGGLLPATVFAMNAQTGSIFYGLWYPIVIAGGDRGHRPDLPAGDQGPRHLHPWRCDRTPSGRSDRGVRTDGAGRVGQRPPSTCRIWPLINPARSEAKNTTALAMSCAVPRRFIAIRSTSAFCPSGP